MDVKEILEQIELRLKCGWPNPMVRQTTEETSAIIAHIRELEARVEVAEARISSLYALFEVVFVGGNHLVEVIGPDHPPAGTEYEKVMGYYKSRQKFNSWCAWNSIMIAREALEKDHGR